MLIVAELVVVPIVVCGLVATQIVALKLFRALADIVYLRARLDALILTLKQMFAMITSRAMVVVGRPNGAALANHLVVLVKQSLMDL